MAYMSEMAEKRRALKIGATVGVFTDKDVADKFAEWGNCCIYCGVSNGAMTADHLVPLSRGGEHMLGNLVPACLSCNSKKHNKYLGSEWMPWS